MKLKKSKMGRPPIPKAQRRSVKLSLRITAALHKAVGKAADAQGKTIGSYVNDVLTAAIRGDE